MAHIIAAANKSVLHKNTISQFLTFDKIKAQSEAPSYVK